MMADPISPPIIDEPVYACAGVLVARGYIAGSSIDIYVASPGSSSATITRLGGGVSYSAIGHVFAVDPTKVVDGSTIYATQTYGGTQSSPSPSVTVQLLPSSAPVSPQLNPPLLECAKCVRIEAAIPGATVVVIDGARVIGSGQAGGATVDVDVSPPLVVSHLVSARDVYCGQNWPPSSTNVGGV